MENAYKEPHIDLDNLNSVQDIETMRAALRSALEQLRSAGQAAAEVRKSRETEKDEIFSLRADLERRGNELNKLRIKEQETAASALTAERSAAAANERAQAFELEKETYAARLKTWESKGEELENARRGFGSLMSQLSEARRLASDSQEALLRMTRLKESVEYKVHFLEQDKEAGAALLKEWENKAAALESTRKGLLSLVDQFPGGTDAKEALLHMLEAKNTAENKVRLLELEKETSASRLRDWEDKAADLESLQKNIEEREKRVRAADRANIEKEAALEQRALALESEHFRRRKELDEFKARMRAEVNDLKPHEAPQQEKDTTP